MTNPLNYPQRSFAAAQPTVTPRPPSVTAAWITYLLMAFGYFAAALLAINSAAFDAAMQAAVVTDIRTNEPGNYAPNTHRVADVEFIRNLFIGVGAVSAFFVLFFAWKMASGRNWARIVLTVGSALAVLSVFGNAASQKIRISQVTYAIDSNAAVNYAIAASGAISLVLLWIKPSNSFFAARRIEWMRRPLRRR